MKFIEIKFDNRPTSTNWGKLSAKRPDYFMVMIILLHIFSSTYPLLTFYLSSTLHLVQQTIRVRIYSQRGNVLFPGWEHFIPNMGISAERFELVV